MDAFLRAMEAAGYEARYARGGVLSFRALGQERFTRLRSTTLGPGYGQEDIQAVIEGRAGSPRKVSLIIDIQSRMRAGKGPAYERWAKIHNLKQMAATLQYLQENDLLEYEQLAQRTVQATDRFHTLSDKIKTVEGAMSANKEWARRWTTSRPAPCSTDTRLRSTFCEGGLISLVQRSGVVY